MQTIKPILFNTEMVRAILGGRKTQTRRILLPNDCIRVKRDKSFIEAWWVKGRVYKSWNSFICDLRREYKPFEVGDILWVRETWCAYDPDHVINGERYAYRADATTNNEEVRKELGYKWHPSIHMPKEAARIFLRVTDMKVTPLQSITNEEALLEGVPGLGDYPAAPVYCPVCKGEGTVDMIDPYTLGHYDDDCDFCDTTAKRFANLWDSTVNGKNYEVNCWDANPWVFVYTFERVDKPEGWCKS